MTITKKHPSAIKRKLDGSLVSRGETKFWVLSTGLFLFGVSAIFLSQSAPSKSPGLEKLAFERLDAEISGQPVSLLKTGSISSPLLLKAATEPSIFSKPVQSNVGVTVLSRAQPKKPSMETNESIAPTAQGADRGHGFAISLGNAQAFHSLSKRFQRVARLNKALFKKLEPRAVLFESSQGLSAKLVAGPFASEQEASNACGVIKIPDGIPCSSEPFDGELISRH